MPNPARSAEPLLVALVGLFVVLARRHAHSANWKNTAELAESIYTKRDN